MADNLSTERRSWNMRQIRSKNTKPEMFIRSALHKKGFRFRLHVSSLPGKPDIVLKKYKTVVFCHGCFWHQHKNCKRATLPKSNTDYWIPKLKRNVERFQEIKAELKAKGWDVITVWECEIKDENILKKIVEEILKE